MNEKLYHYTFLEAGKYPRSAYVWSWSLKAVKKDIEKNFISPARIKIRLIGEETEEFVKQIKIRKAAEFPSIAK
jgi:hypothetical protein